MTKEFRNYKLSDDVNARIDRAQEILPGKPMRIIELIRTFGLDVWTASFEPGYAGAIIKSPDTGKYTVYLNKLDPKPRQRFTCAHEFAHYLLHREEIGSDFNENVLFRSHLSNEKEVDANKIAADILMPMPMIDKMMEERKSNIPSLADIFGVSHSAILVRLGIPR